MVGMDVNCEGMSGTGLSCLDWSFRNPIYCLLYRCLRITSQAAYELSFAKDVAFQQLLPLVLPIVNSNTEGDSWNWPWNTWCEITILNKKGTVWPSIMALRTSLSRWILGQWNIIEMAFESKQARTYFQPSGGTQLLWQRWMWQGNLMIGNKVSGMFGVSPQMITIENA